MGGPRILRLALVALAVSATSPAAAEPWWGADKAKHLGVGLALGTVAYSGLWLLGDDPPAARLGLGTFVAVLPGVAKELLDSGQPENLFSWADLFWTGVGVLVGNGGLFALDLLLGMPQDRDTPRLQLVPNGAGAAVLVRFR